MRKESPNSRRQLSLSHLPDIQLGTATFRSKACVQASEHAVVSTHDSEGREAKAAATEKQPFIRWRATKAPRGKAAAAVLSDDDNYPFVVSYAHNPQKLAGLNSFPPCQDCMNAVSPAQ